MSLLRDDSAKEWFELPRKKYPKGRRAVIQELLEKMGIDVHYVGILLTMRRCL